MSEDKPEHGAPSLRKAPDARSDVEEFQLGEIRIDVVKNAMDDYMNIPEGKNGLVFMGPEKFNPDYPEEIQYHHDIHGTLPLTDDDAVYMRKVLKRLQEDYLDEVLSKDEDDDE